MKYFVDVNGGEHEVEVRERLGVLTVWVDGEELPVDYCEVDRQGQASLMFGERSFAVSIEGDRNQNVMTVAGRLFHVEIEDERERAAHAAEREAQKGGGLVKSVMPGIVVDVMVEVGATVEEGQALLILEAMKMQNEIRATSAGVVKVLHVKAGEAVGSGAKLITIEAAEG